MAIKESQQENITPWNIKKIYETFRRRSTPGYKSGTKFDDCWIKLSNILKEKHMPRSLFGEFVREMGRYSVSTSAMWRALYDNLQSIPRKR